MKLQQPLREGSLWQTVLNPYEKSQDENTSVIPDALTNARASFFFLPEGSGHKSFLPERPVDSGFFMKGA